MEENKSNEQNVNTEEVKKDNTINTEEVKKEAKNTLNQVKNTIKNSNFKKDANEVKGFFIRLFKNPIQEINTVACSSKNEFLKIAIIIFVVWLIVALLGSIVEVFQSYSYMNSYYSSFEIFFKNSVSNIFDILRAVLAPILSLVVLTLTIYLLQKSERKSFITIAISVLTAKIPFVAACIVDLLQVFGKEAHIVLIPVASFFNIISTVLLYFATKSLFNEKDDTSSIKKFALVMGIYYIAAFALRFLEIYI